MNLARNWKHLCIDMQRLFNEDTPWRVEWMSRVLPNVAEVSANFPEQTIFTRFIPPERAQDAPGMWAQYYAKWWMMTGEHLPRELLELPACLARLVPPARIIDKRIYSPWLEGQLHQSLQQCGVDTVVLTGGETDVCVLATVLGAVDLGYRVLVLEDAVCSGADQTHDAALRLLGERFSAQLTLSTTADFLHSKGDVRALTPPSR